jgi:hypothetical protein
MMARSDLQLRLWLHGSSFPCNRLPPRGFVGVIFDSQPRGQTRGEEGRRQSQEGRARVAALFDLSVLAS